MTLSPFPPTNIPTNFPPLPCRACRPGPTPPRLCLACALSQNASPLSVMGRSSSALSRTHSSVRPRSSAWEAHSSGGAASDRMLRGGQWERGVSRECLDEAGGKEVSDRWRVRTGTNGLR